MNQQKGTGLFNLIAPVYSLFFNYQIKMFDDILKSNHKNIFTQNKKIRILDIGCGTGALIYMISERGHHCTGVDISSGMIRYAKKKLCGLDVELLHDDPMDPNLFKKDQFDMVFLSYVLHGLHKEKRMTLLQRALTLAGDRVVIIDYLTRGSRLTDFFEWMERGDYFRFVKEFQDEIQSLTDNFRVLAIKNNGGLFIIDKER